MNLFTCSLSLSLFLSLSLSALAANSKHNSSKCKFLYWVLFIALSLSLSLPPLSFSPAPLVIHPQSMNGLRRSFLCRVKRGQSMLASPDSTSSSNVITSFYLLSLSISLSNGIIPYMYLFSITILIICVYFSIGHNRL